MRNYSLKSLLFFVLIVLCAVAALCKYKNDCEKQQATREAIKKCGGLAVLRTSDSHDPKSFFYVHDNNECLSRLMKYCFGEDSIADVVLVDLLRATKVSQSLRKEIRSLKGVRAIFLNENFTSLKSWGKDFPDVVLVSFSSGQIIVPSNMPEKQLSYWSTAYPSYEIVLNPRSKPNKTKLLGARNETDMVKTEPKSPE